MTNPGFRLLFAAGVALPCAAQASYVLLPADQARAAVAQCSRSAPQADAGWTPSAQDVAALEAQLGDIAKLSSRYATISHPEQSFREYVGIVVGGRHLIYVNAMPLEASHQRRRVDPASRPTVVCDGGPAFWGAVFDPATQHFADLQTNGGWLK